MLVTITAWDDNCLQHIPQSFEAAALAEWDEHIRLLEAELEELKSGLSARR